MNVIFIAILFLAFISLGLPDTLLGSAWPVMQTELGVSLDAQGLITTVVYVATIASCLLNDRLVRKLGPGRITAISGAVTAAALLGYSQSQSYVWLLLFAIPLGLGAGSVDTCLNNYVALHLTARHVNWLQCCYGLGAALGPLILSLVLGQGENWRGSYLLISIIQFIIAAILFSSLPLWKRREKTDLTPEPPAESPASGEKTPLFKIPGVALALLSYAVFFSIEYGAALWAPSYLVSSRGFAPESAARTATVFYVLIMTGRFAGGIVSKYLSDKTLIRIGAALGIVGTVLLAVPLPGKTYYVAMALIGLGCAPIFPAMIHMTPARFGRLNAPRIMGVQMAAAYAGDVVIVPFIGILAKRAGVITIPWFLLALCILILILSELTDRVIARKN